MNATLFDIDTSEEEIKKPIALRDYQTRSLYGDDNFPGIIPALKEHGSTILVLPTGCGKTVVFTEVAKLYRQAGKRVLVLAHRQRLLSQAYDKFVGFGRIPRYDIGFELGDQTIHQHRVPSIVLASKDSLHEKRLMRYDPDTFDLIIIDESHRGVAKTYRRIYEHFKNAQRLGVTATPDRLDGKSLRSIFDSVGYVYEIRDAIESGYLVPIIQEYVDVSSIDLSQVRITAGDLNEQELNEIMCRDENIYRVVEPMLERAGDRPTLMFSTTIQHAQLLADVANSYRPGCARAISGKDSPEQQEEKIRDLEAGRYQFLANCALLTEGIDIPSIACIVMACPTRSRNKYAQAVGRGTRLLGSTLQESIENGKEDLLVLDFVGVAGRHTLVTALDCLDGNTDDDVRTEAIAIIREAGGRGEKVAALDALEEAAKRIAERKRNAIRRVGVSYTTTVIDPFTVLGVTARPGRYGGMESTEAQRRMLINAGLKEKEVASLDKGQASAIIAEIIRRREKGLCSYKQSRILTKYGIDSDIPFSEASGIIGILSRHDWKFDGEARTEVDKFKRLFVQDDRDLPF